MLLTILQCTGQPSPSKELWPEAGPKCQQVQGLRNSALRKSMCLGFPFFKTESINIKGKSLRPKKLQRLQGKRAGREMKGEKPPLSFRGLGSSAEKKFQSKSRKEETGGEGGRCCWECHVAYESGLSSFPKRKKSRLRFVWQFLQTTAGPFLHAYVETEPGAPHYRDNIWVGESHSICVNHTV